MPDFLLEIGCEEIPARMIDAASQELRERVNALLNRERLTAKGTITYLDTPRRLAVLVPDIPAAQADISEQITGPAVTVAFKDGQPTPAAHAFAKKSGMHISQLDRISTPKGDYLSARITKKGRAAREIISELLPKEISSIYWPKNMYWRKRGEVFVRPVRWREDKNLLDTVVNLTEFPSAILGSFDPEFLALPEEVLVTVMRDHQKYFAVEDSNHELLPHFLAVLNTDSDPQGIIRHGHERVLRARFNDARFFWQTDQKHSLRERVTWLKQVTFQKDLGTYYEKTRRVQRVCSWLAESIRQSGIAIRPGVVHKAACLAKADLTTELVKEFTELQGIVGGLYARVQDLDRDMKEDAQQSIATAIYDHYKPESMEDSVPRTIEGAVLSISDKADSIAGMFSLGLVPSGSKDPFALRRQANGFVKIIAEHKLPLNLAQLFEYAREAYRGSAAEKKFSASLDYADALRSFFRERLEFYLRDVLGFKYDVVNAVLAAGADDVVDALVRAEALTQVRPSEDFESISASFKRIKNILRQASENQKQVAASIDSNLLREPAERELAAAIPQISKTVESLRGERRYQQALLEISRLRPAVDTFFDKVMVMVEDEPLRANRLALLQTLLKEFSTIADFSAIVTEKEKGTAGS